MGKLYPAYRAIMMGLDIEVDKAKLATEFVTLATSLKSEGKWKKVREEVVNEPDTLALVSSILRAEKMEERFIRKALDILKNADYTPEEKKDMAKEESVVPKIAESMSAEQVLRIDQMMEKVTDSMEKSTLEPVVTEVVELALARRGREKAEIECLSKALEGAAEEKQGLAMTLALREQEICALEGQVAGLLGRLAAAREEVADLRGQHGKLSAEADSTREKLSRQLQEKQEEIQQVKGEKENLEVAMGKYREKYELQKESLKTYKENEEVMKAKEEKEMKLKKGEEKLKKKERQLEEEQAAREKAEKEGEDLTKQCQQLQALSNSQAKALAKKEKAIQESDAEIKDLRKLQETIFNLSKVRSGSSGSAA